MCSSDLLFYVNFFSPYGLFLHGTLHFLLHFPVTFNPRCTANIWYMGIAIFKVFHLATCSHIRILHFQTRIVVVAHFAFSFRRTWESPLSLWFFGYFQETDFHRIHAFFSVKTSFPVYTTRWYIIIHYTNKFRALEENYSPPNIGWLSSLVTGSIDRNIYVLRFKLPVHWNQLLSFPILFYLLFVDRKSVV